MEGVRVSAARVRRLRHLGLATGVAVSALLSCAPAVKPEHAVFRVALPYRPEILDPHALSLSSYSSVLWNVYDRLVVLDEDLRLEPALARHWSSPDPQTLRLELREGVRFHDGAPLRAADVVYSIARVLEDPTLDMGYYLAGVAGVRAVGPAAIELRTHRPQPTLINRLSFIAIVPENSGPRLAHSSVGTGPFVISAWSPRQSVSLRRNERYWGPPPELEEVVFHLGSGQREIASGLREGRYQLAILTETPIRELPAGALRYQVISRESLLVRYLGFDMASEVTPFCEPRPNPFRDRRVRRAVHLALDRASLTAELPELVPLWQLVPPAVFGFDPTIEHHARDLATASRLLREAGVGGGFRVTLHTRAFMRRAAQWVAGQLSAVRIHAAIEILPEARYFEAIKRGELSFWLDNFGCTSGESGELFENAMHSADPAKGLGAFNESGFWHPEIDALIAASQRARGAKERRDILIELMRKTMDEVPWVPLFVDREFYAIAEPFRWRPHPNLMIRLAGVQTVSPSQP